jgi:ABC-type sulfate/molybdate transport systems ATPase subunit
MNPPRLEFDRLRVVRGGREVLALERLQLAPGEVVAVTGENGAGKSSLLLAAAGLLDLAAGEVRLGGGAVHRGRAPAPRAFRLGLGLALQEPCPLHGTVLENAGLGLRARGQDRAERNRRALDALRALGLEALAARPARGLSGGERKLLSLAQLGCLALPLLLLDEPSAGVDGDRLLRVETWVRGVRAAGGAVLLATHDHGLAGRLAERVLRLEAGAVVQ